MTAPEPWREQPLPKPKYKDRHPYERPGESELSWGDGLVAPHLNGLPPSEGGLYMPKAPRVDPPRNEYGVGVPRQHPRPDHEARGYPGDEVVR